MSTDAKQHCLPASMSSHALQKRAGTCVIIVVSLFFSLLVSGCSVLPPAPEFTPTFSLPPAKKGVLAEVAASVAAQFDNEQSGFLPVLNSRDGLRWRLALVDHATTSIDAQYFIWQDDAAGNLLFERLLAAADRGVRVRLMVDDFALAASDREIGIISHHPNLEIKIFNPVASRSSLLIGLLDFLFNFEKLNRRMHNKLFVVDNLMAIAGGRNIGNEYFGLSDSYNFRDLDVLTTGPVIMELAEAFDSYWNSEVAYSGTDISRTSTSKDLQSLRSKLQADLVREKDRLHSYPLVRTRWDEDLQSLPTVMLPGTAHFLQDVPIDAEGEELRLVEMLDSLASPSHEQLVIITPYLIPRADFLENLARLSSEGVDVTVLTSSMGANNHTMAHSHYKKYRRPLLTGGADIYEFRHDPSEKIRQITDVPPVRADFISLHIKALVGDGERCFIGSLNLDPRAVEINTENGLYIESPELARKLLTEFQQMMTPQNAWHLSLHDDGRLLWSSDAGTVSSQPARSFGQRIADFFFRLLPVESQL